ncbi:DUF917-domain-containing protein [Colletotrichum tofieldiae]|nr:DUF917-domain-containing protein [Colletotrichum tofieldiae]
MQEAQEDSTNTNVAAVSGDWMGCAYPTEGRTTPEVFNLRTIIWTAVAVSDDKGNIVTMARASSDKQVEQVICATLAEMGSQIAIADPQVTEAETKWWVVEYIHSQAMADRPRGRQVEKNVVAVARPRYFGRAKIVGVELEGFAKIPFKNENTAAVMTTSAMSESRKFGKEKQEDVLVIISDLITIIDVQNGKGIGMPEYTYGLLNNCLDYGGQ